MNLSLIFLAGGVGKRMGAKLPKQFLLLNARPVVHHSLEVFLSCPEIDEIIVVCAPEYRNYFEKLPVRFASPGKERQDSVFNGLQHVSRHTEWVCIHDGARPFITAELLSSLFSEGKKIGAAALGTPTKSTLKESKTNLTIKQTVDRSKIWEIQTPQFLKKDVLEAGFNYAHTHDIAVTDDVSLAELIHHPVKLVQGSYQNIKITTPEDLYFAEWLINSSYV